MGTVAWSALVDAAMEPTVKLAFGVMLAALVALVLLLQVARTMVVHGNTSLVAEGSQSCFLYHEQQHNRTPCSQWHRLSPESQWTMRV